MNIIANEPSLAFFRIQEHVRRCLPLLAETKQEVQDLQQQVQGACFDTEYAANAVADMHKSSAHFQKVQELLKNAMFNKQQIDYDQSRREQKKLHPSMYTTTSSPDIKSANLDCDTANTPLQKSKTAIAGSEAESVNRSPKPDQARRQKHGLTRLETIN